MSELVFYPRTLSLPLAEVAARAGIAAPEGADPTLTFAAAAALDRARPDEISLYDGTSDVDELRATRAGVCFVGAEHAADVPATTVALVTERPIEAFSRVAAALHPQSSAASPVGLRGGIDATAVVDDSARLEVGVSIEPGAIIGAGAEIGAGTSVGAHSVIGPGVRIGRGCVIDSHADIRTALIGDRVVIQTGAKIGILASRAKPGPRLGRVIIQDDVEVGANAAIERGGLTDTTIGEGTRIAALVVVPSETTIDRHQAIDRSSFPRP